MRFDQFNYTSPELTTFLSQYPSIKSIRCGGYRDGGYFITIYRINGQEWRLRKEVDEKDKALLIELGLKEEDIQRIQTWMNENYEIIFPYELRIKLPTLVKIIFSLNASGEIIYD